MKNQWSSFCSCTHKDIDHPLMTHSAEPNAPTRSLAFLSCSSSCSSSVFARVLDSSSRRTGTGRPGPFLCGTGDAATGCGGFTYKYMPLGLSIVRCINSHTCCKRSGSRTSFAPEASASVTYLFHDSRAKVHTCRSTSCTTIHHTPRRYSAWSAEATSRMWENSWSRTVGRRSNEV